MKCPYCNKKLIITYNGLACSNMRCEKSRGMIGTEPMWEKVASLAKIRDAGDRYRVANKAKMAAYQREWRKKQKEKKCED